MRSRAVSRPLLCWLSMAFGPPPSRIFSSSLRTCETMSARKRMLASKRGEVASTRVSRTLELDGVLDSYRSAMKGTTRIHLRYNSAASRRKRARRSTETQKGTQGKANSQLAHNSNRFPARFCQDKMPRAKCYCQMLSAFFHPLIQSAPVIFEQEASC